MFLPFIPVFKNKFPMTPQSLPVTVSRSYLYLHNLRMIHRKQTSCLPLGLAGQVNP
jgi:hypothetical protein